MERDAFNGKFNFHGQIKDNEDFRKYCWWENTMDPRKRQ